MILRYLTHPQVVVDPAVPVPKWHLSKTGRARLEAISRPATLRKTTAVFSSTETKAIETAELLANPLGLVVTTVDAMGENDRSATGFLEPEEFERTADQFFAHPRKSIRGWERAVDAQQRIVEATTNALRGHSDGDVLLVGHGAVGTLLYCHFSGLPINRAHDQTGDGGNWFAVDLDSGKPLHSWRPLELMSSGR